MSKFSLHKRLETRDCKTRDARRLACPVSRSPVSRVPCQNNMQFNFEQLLNYKPYTMKKISILSLMILMALTSFAQWQQIKSTAGAIEVMALFDYSDKMFVMEPGSGLFTKSMSDTEWTNCNSTYLIGVPVNGFFYGTYGSKQFFKIDLNHPENQAEVFFTYPYNYGYSNPFYPCIIKYCDGNLLVGSYAFGFSILGLDGSEMTYNNGLLFAWPEESQEVNAITFDEQYYYCNAENAYTYGYAIYRCSKELDESWQLMNEGLPDNWATKHLECFDGRLFVAYGKQLYKSDDRAEHWDSLFTAPSDVTMLDQMDGLLYLGTKSHGLFQSSDNGATWTNLGLQGQTVNKIMKHGGSFFAGTNNGVFVQQDQDWFADNYGIAVSSFTSMLIMDNHIICLESGSNKLFRLEDNRSYTDISPNIWMKHVSSMTTGDGMLFVSYYSYDSSIGNLRDYLIYSSDNGLSWNTIELPSVFPGPSLSSHSKKLLYDEGKLYVYEDKIMAYTSDWGQTWTEVSLLYPPDSPRGFGSVIKFGNQLYCSCCDQVDPVLMKLENDQWVRLAANGIPNGIARLSRLDDNLVAFSVSDNCYLSNDGGENFVSMDNGYMPDMTRKMAFSYQDRLFVSNRFANQCIESTHQVWRKFNGLSSENTIGLVALDDTLFLSLNNHGLWRMPVDDLQYEFIQTGSEWYYEIHFDDGSTTYQHLEYTADTTIGNERPKIIVRSNTQYDRDTIFTEVTHEYILEGNNKVYWWNMDLEEFTTLYDYSAEPGDEWEIKVGTESITVHVDSVGFFEYYDGTMSKRIHISDPGNIFSGDIVVGYGHMTSFFPEKLMNRNAGYTVDGLRCYWVGNALLYHNCDEDCDAVYAQIHAGVEENGPSTGSVTAGALVVYPNPANNVLFVETWRAASLPNQAYRITNLMGQSLMTGTLNPVETCHGTSLQRIDILGLPAGMYFINLGNQTKKFVKQ